MKTALVIPTLNAVKRGFRAVEGALQIDSQNSVPLVFAHPYEEGVFSDAGVVDENVQRAEVGLDLLHQRLHFSQI